MPAFAACQYDRVVFATLLLIPNRGEERDLANEEQYDRYDSDRAVRDSNLNR